MQVIFPSECDCFWVVLYFGLIFVFWCYDLLLFLSVCTLVAPWCVWYILLVLQLWFLPLVYGFCFVSLAFGCGLGLLLLSLQILFLRLFMGGEIHLGPWWLSWILFLVGFVSLWWWLLVLLRWGCCCICVLVGLGRCILLQWRFFCSLLVACCIRLWRWLALVHFLVWLIPIISTMMLADSILVLFSSSKFV